MQALASTTFCVAAMLAYGELEYEIPEQHRQDRKILAVVDVTTIEPDDEGTHMDASVEVELADGSRRMRASKEAPATLFFHDRAMATRLFEQRLAAAFRTVTARLWRHRYSRPCKMAAALTSARCSIASAVPNMLIL